MKKEPDVDQTWSASPTPGVLRFAGEQPTVNSDGSVTTAPAAGALRLVGQQPEVDQTWSVDPQAGTLRLVGQEPTVLVTQSVSPSAGTLRLVGNQPAVDSWWFNQALYPTAVSLTGMTGAYTDIDENPSTPDDNWLLAA